MLYNCQRLNRVNIKIKNYQYHAKRSPEEGSTVNSRNVGKIKDSRGNGQCQIRYSYYSFVFIGTLLTTKYTVSYTAEKVGVGYIRRKKAQYFMRPTWQSYTAGQVDSGLNRRTSGQGIQPSRQYIIQPTKLTVSYIADQVGSELYSRPSR
jgi:hypothetical protein